MRSKSLYLLVACICGSIAAVFASQWLNAQANANKGSTAEIFVAAVDINVGEGITAERIKLEQWPVDKVPTGASGDLESLEGKYAKQRFYAGEPIMPVKLMDENWEAVPKGFQTVGLSAAGINIARVIQPGDRVDVTAYFNKSDLIPRDIVKQVLMGVRVYSLDGDTQRRIGEDRPKTVRSIELMIHKNDVEAWTWANELGKIRLSLGSDADYSTADGSNEAGKEFVTWLNEQRERQEARDAPIVKTTSAPTTTPEPEKVYSGFDHTRKTYIQPVSREQRYVASGGTKCPVCGAGGPEGVKTYGINEGVYSQQMSCLECESTWVEGYRLSDLTEVNDATAE